jgi:hypothetical protein
MSLHKNTKGQLMKAACLAVAVIVLSGTSAYAERITPPGNWLRMMKLTIRSSLGARDWARISGVYVDHIIRTGDNPVCGKVTATLANDTRRITRSFYGVVSVDQGSKLATLVHFDVATDAVASEKISTRCAILGLTR